MSPSRRGLRKRSHQSIPPCLRPPSFCPPVGDLCRISLERNISPTPVALRDLTEVGWRQALKEASDCLDSRRKRRGRAVQAVTLANGTQVQGDVSPHLMFRYFGDADVEWEQLFREGKERMQSLYEWARRRSARAMS
jgi:hypothetical protein